MSDPFALDYLTKVGNNLGAMLSAGAGAGLGALAGQGAGSLLADPLSHLSTDRPIAEANADIANLSKNLPAGSAPLQAPGYTDAMKAMDDAVNAQHQANLAAGLRHGLTAGGAALGGAAGLATHRNFRQV